MSDVDDLIDRAKTALAPPPCPECGGDHCGIMRHELREILADLVPELVSEIERLQAQNDVMHRCIAERPQYITAIKNCRPDNHSDYWRWQGHAEVRRQLTEALAALEA